MRPLWNGTLAFGLVVIPVRLYAATERKSPSFNLLHAKCGTPVKYLKWCPTCDREIAQDEITRAFEYAKGEYVTISDEEMEAIPGPAAHVIEILDFVELSQVDPVYFEKSFFLEPREGAGKAYALLRKAMEEQGKVAVARVAIRAKETLALIRVYKGRFIMMETMYWGNEVRQGEELSVPEDVHLDEREMSMAKTLMETLTSDFEPGKYENRQRQALSDLIEKKVQGREIVREPERAGAQVIDLMEALRRSVEKAKADEGRQKGRTAADGKPRARRRRASGEGEAAAPPPA